MSDRRVWGGNAIIPLHVSNGVLHRCDNPDDCSHKPESWTLTTDKEREDEVMEMLAVWFHENLRSLPPTHPAIKDIVHRRLTLANPILGWVPDSGRILEWAGRNDITIEELLKTGVIDVCKDEDSEEGFGYQQFCESRLSFAVRDETGSSVLRFYARGYGLDRQKQKYSSSRLRWSDDPLRRELFGANVAMASPSDRFVLVEGQFDALACHAAGIMEAIALQGAETLHEGELDVFLETGRRIVICTDGDEAGLNGMCRLASILEGKAQVSVIILPDGDDPCDYRISHGSMALRDALSDEMSVEEALTSRHLTSSTALGKRKPYKERRRWIIALNGGRKNPVPLENAIETRCGRSEVFRLLTGLARAAMEEGKEVPFDLPKPLRNMDAQGFEQAKNYGEQGSYDDLLIRAQSLLNARIKLQ